MAKKRVAKKKRITRKSVQSKGSARKSASGTEILGKEWKLGEIAWNDDGNIIILQPRLAAFLRKQVLKDREFQMAIPKTPVDVGRKSGGGAGYDPYPDPNALPVRPKGWHGPLELCACRSLQFYLIKEAPVQHQLLSSKPAY